MSSLANQYKKYLDGCGGETSYLTAITDITLGKRIISICVRLISGTLALKKSKKIIYWRMTLKLKYIMVKSTVLYHVILAVILVKTEFTAS